MDKSLTEIIGEMPLVWADHIVAAYLLGLKDMLQVQHEPHKNIYFDVYKEQAQAVATGRRYEYKEGIDL